MKLGRLPCRAGGDHTEGRAPARLKRGACRKDWPPWPLAACDPGHIFRHPGTQSRRECARRHGENVWALYDLVNKILPTGELTMLHQFLQSSAGSIAGIWIKPTGRRYCMWRYDAATGELAAKRGTVVRTQSVDAETAQSKEELSRLALELAGTKAAA